MAKAKRRVREEATATVRVIRANKELRLAGLYASGAVLGDLYEETGGQAMAIIQAQYSELNSEDATKIEEVAGMTLATLALMMGEGVGSFGGRT